MSEPFSAEDRAQLAGAGLDLADAEAQLALLREPPPSLSLRRPATLGDGILRLDDDEAAGLEDTYAEAARAGRVARFVPASGAASRMFAALRPLLDGAVPARDELAVRAGRGDPAAEAALELLARLPDFPFYEALAEAIAAAGDDLEACRRRGDLATLLTALLTPVGLDLGEQPKALVPFHRYPGERRTAFAEHLVEAAETALAGDGRCVAHFTVQPEHEPRFLAELARLSPAYERRWEARFEVSFSHQSRASDTLAVDPSGSPFRRADGRLLLRPGGHGALLPNLAAVAARPGIDLLVVKNVDNVVPDSARPLVALWKRRLGGKLLALRRRSFELLDRLETAGADTLEEVVADTVRFLTRDLTRPLPAALAGRGAESLRDVLVRLLDRPMRVCGVVHNLGEPGGGPFWAAGADGETSLQIVERSQVDPASAAQQAVFAASTHFNPVDLVCATRDRHGRPYPLARFVDPTTVFLADKTYEGRPLRALERPGLWNGAMAGWNTVFVEVPDATFAPVKTVFDLLRPAHQTGVAPGR